MILEFGNMEHIKLAEKGIICQRGHAKASHNQYGDCSEKDVNDKEVKCYCECGDEHWAAAECDCVEFKLES